MIPQHVIEQVRDRTDVTELVGQYVDLKRAGTNYKGLCPFHQERTPSFIVSPERQTFHCFGCGKGGNVFTFLMEMDGVTFPEAVRALADKAGIQVDTRGADEDHSEQDALFQTNTFAARFYYHQLMKSPAADKARRYLEGRGIPREAWTHFGLGFAPATGDSLYAHARQHKAPLELLAKLQLVKRRDNGDGYYDYFRDRVMFPIVAPGSRVVAFGARTFGDAQPKYLNSTESLIYQKRRAIYGLDRAHEAIRKARHAVVVEGYTDLIRLHLSGVTQTIATCGTALTRDHAARIRRLTRRVLLVPDGDPAGETAAMVSGGLLMAEGVEVGVVPLQTGQDPDSAARSMSPQDFEKLLGRPLEYFAFLDYTIEQRNPGAREREELIRRVLSVFAQTDDPLRADVLIGELAKVFGRNKADVLEMAGQPKLLATGATEPVRARPRESSTRTELERLVLRLIMDGTPAAILALESLDVEEFSAEANRKFYKVLDSAREANVDLRGRDFLRRAEEVGLEGYLAEINAISVPPGNVDTLLNDTVRKLKKLRIGDEIAQFSEKQQAVPPDSEEAVAIAAHIQRLQQAKAEL
ncbi:MAG TPA: DNA primase [Candidatus Krumholzibacteria bacterium]|nr:DNA primase [Candidatus Krumholzibacteria bacterium]